jgi:DNA-binding Lrp family transcriptional regulator
VYLEILETLVEMGVYELGALSSRVGLSEALVEQLVGELGKRGYIKRLVPGCEARCAGCSMSGTCDELRSPSGWTFTEKGTAMVNQGDGGFGDAGEEGG